MASWSAPNGCGLAEQSLGDGILPYLLLVFIGLALLLIPYAGLMLCPLWCFAMVFAVAKDGIGRVRWRRGYKSSIGRMTRKCRNRK